MEKTYMEEQDYLRQQETKIYNQAGHPYKPFKEYSTGKHTDIIAFYTPDLILLNYSYLVTIEHKKSEINSVYLEYIDITLSNSNVIQITGDHLVAMAKAISTKKVEYVHVIQEGFTQEENTKTLIASIDMLRAE